MSDQRFDPVTRKTQSLADDAPVRALLEEAGVRPGVPDADMVAIKHAFRQAWQAEVHVPRAPRGSWRRATRRRVLALAASLLAGLGLAWWWTGSLPSFRPSHVVAAIDQASGQIAVFASDTVMVLSPASMGTRHELTLGAAISTVDADGGGTGRIAFRLADGPSIRLDTGSRLRVVSDSVLYLERGAVYIDSEPAARGRGGVEIQTLVGAARDIGTQFEVRLLDAGSAARMRIRVRGGEVRVEQDDIRHVVVAEEELTLDAGGTVERSAITLHGSAWAWIQAAAPPFEGEGKTVGEILDWIVREMGWTVRWTGSARSATADVFRGSIEHLTPDQACEVVLTSAGLDFELAEGVLVVGLRSSS